MHFRNTLLAVIFIVGFCSCRNGNGANANHAGHPNNLSKIFSDYWEERMKLFPLEATSNGDNRYNDRMTNTISAPFRDSLQRFFTKYLAAANGVDTAALSKPDKLSWNLFHYEMQMNLDGMKFPTWYLPINQFWGLTLDLPQLGSGQGNQPFKTVRDYDNFLKRMSVFPAWTDTAISNMRLGMAAGWVLPKALVVKILPQLKAIYSAPSDSSIFSKPLAQMPDSFSKENKARLTIGYNKMIAENVVPNYKKLYDFMETEYLPKARATSGIGGIPQGGDYYKYLIKNWTTTDLTADSIYNLGLAEVARIEGEMNTVKTETRFTGDLHAFFAYLNKDAKFFPFKTPKAVLDSFWNIKKAEDPGLQRLFNHVPKSPFTIRQTEAFRAASASAEYNPPSEDGSRPGIFYVPIIDATKFNAVGMETLFLHEAIPGHHYQISLQQENKGLPQFRKFLWYGAYGEGWALYSESLGKELGVFTNPYQYFGHLSDEMHRAIRLVVDAGLHAKGMTREQAIDYMLAHEATTREGATAEIERYMAIPAQALSYKMGQLTIRALRTKYEALLGSKFSIKSFHDEVLGGGCVPLNILTQNIDEWAKEQQ